MSSTLQVNKRPSQLDKPATVPHTRVDDELELDNMFSMGKRLGQGSFGIVREAVDISSGKKWAVKAVNKEKAGSSAVKLLEREVSILKRVNHEHIIHLEQVFETSKKMYLVMELCEHGELANLLKVQHHFKEEEVTPIIRDLASAISYLHKNDIVHRDLKLENILVHRNEESGDLHIKVTDFGLSVVKDGVGHENMMQQFCGTPIYMPPEIVDNKTYSQQCDVWAMGVIAYYLLTGSPPFKARDEESLYDYIKKGDIDFQGEHIRDCSASAHECIQGMLKVDPAHRLTASEVLDHHWITGVQNGSANVLVLMKKWKDELNEDGEDDTGHSSSTEQEISESPDEGQQPKNNKSELKSQNNLSKSIKGNKPRSAGSKMVYGGNNNKLSLNHIHSKHNHLTSSHTNYRSAHSLHSNVNSSSTPNMAPIHRQRSPIHNLSSAAPASSPVPATDSSLLLQIHITEASSERSSNSGGKRTSPLTTVNRSSTAIATRKKPEKSPPSQSIKTANKK